MTEQKKKWLKARIAVSLFYVLGRRPTEQEIERFFIAAQVLYTTVLGVHFERQEQKRNGQIPLF